MVGEDQQKTIGNRVYETLDTIHQRYEAGERRVRKYTPYVIRTIEVVIAVALFVGVARWFYLFYFV